MADSIRPEVFFRIVRPKIWFLRIKEPLDKVSPGNEKCGRTIPLDNHILLS